MVFSHYLISNQAVNKMNLSTVVILLLFSTTLYAKSCNPDSVYLVRHAEKQAIEGERNPPLTEQGLQRANALATVFKDIHLDKIFSSEFKRTQQTVEPTAKIKHLDIEIRDAKLLQELADEILLSCGKSILVAGHSNTVPQLMKALGLSFEVKVDGQNLRFEPVIYLNDKKDYGSLFKVIFTEENKPKLELSTF